MEKVILLTGGSGFVGRNIIPKLQEAGYEVRALARSEKSQKAVKNYGAIPVKGDLTDLSSLKSAVEGCHKIVHAAAHMEFWGPEDPFLQINVNGTQNMLQAAEAAGVEKFLYIGAASVINGQAIHNRDESFVPNQLP